MNSRLYEKLEEFLDYAQHRQDWQVDVPVKIITEFILSLSDEVSMLRRRVEKLEEDNDCA